MVEKNIFWTTNIGEVLTIIVALIAVIFATMIGIKQNKINNSFLELRNIVELYILFQPITIKDIKEQQNDVILPAMIVRNLGSSVIYLNKYIFNGKEYPLYDEVLPPVSQFDGFHYIYLPTDGTTHVSFDIFFTSTVHEKWETKGYADLIDGGWKITYEPCRKSTNLGLNK